MKSFEFKINEVMPIGLDGEGQRPIHTNVFGRIIQGSIKAGDNVHVPLINGTERRVAVKGLMTEWRSPDRFPEILTADMHGKLISGMAIRIPPSEAGQIDNKGVIWADNTDTAL